MKKLLSLMLAAILTASVFIIPTGCSEETGDEVSPSAVDASFDEEELIEADANFDEEELIALLNEINNCSYTSVGGTLRVAEIAADIKNWVQLNKPDTDKVNDIAAKYFVNFNDKQKAAFQKNYDVIAYAESLLWLDLGTSVDILAQKAGAYMQFEYEDCDDELEQAFMDAINFEFDYQKPDSGKDPTIKNSTEANFDKKTYLKFLLDASNIEVGTAGSYYSMQLCAANFMQFVVDNRECTQNEIKEGMKECYNLLSITDRINFDGYFEDIMDTIDQFIQNPSEITDLEKSVDMDNFSKSLLYRFVDFMPEISGVHY